MICMAGIDDLNYSGIGDAVKIKVNDAEAGWFRVSVEKCSRAGRIEVLGRVGEPASPVTAGVC